MADIFQVNESGTQFRAESGLKLKFLSHCKILDKCILTEIAL